MAQFDCSFLLIVGNCINIENACSRWNVRHFNIQTFLLLLGKKNLFPIVSNCIAMSTCTRLYPGTVNIENWIMKKMLRCLKNRDEKSTAVKAYFRSPGSQVVYLRTQIFVFQQFGEAFFNHFIFWSEHIFPFFFAVIEHCHHMWSHLM